MKRKTLIAGAMALVMSLSTPIASFGAIKYVYTPNPAGYPWDLANTEYFTPVKSLMDRNIIKWNPDGYFHPERTITRAELATIVAKITGHVKFAYQEIEGDYFDDLEGYGWAKQYISICKAHDLMQGRGDRIFDPKGEVSYVEFMAIVARIQNPQMELPGSWPDNYIFYSKTVLNNLTSDRNITDWNAPITRGDVAYILYKGASKKIAVELNWKDRMEKEQMVAKWRLPDPNQKK